MPHSGCKFSISQLSHLERGQGAPRLLFDLGRAETTNCAPTPGVPSTTSGIGMRLRTWSWVTEPSKEHSDAGEAGASGVCADMKVHPHRSVRAASCIRGA
jgi:hypothetical protein